MKFFKIFLTLGVLLILLAMSYGTASANTQIPNLDPIPQPEPRIPDTFSYMLWGYAIGLVILVFSIGTIWYRHRTLNRDEALLQTLEREESFQKNYDSKPS
jgi:hypothetical protein